MHIRLTWTTLVISLTERTNNNRKQLSIPLIAILFAQFSQALGQSLYSPFISPWLFDLGGKSFFKYAVAASVPYFLMFITAPIWGKISDSLKKRKFFLTLGLLGFTFQYWSLIFVQTEEQFLLVVMVMAIIIGAYQANLMSLASFQVPRSQSGQVIALMNISLSVAWLIGSPIGGIAYDHLKATARFIQLPFAGLILMISAAIVYWLVPEPDITQLNETEMKNIYTNADLEKISNDLATRENSKTDWTILIWIALLGLLLNVAAGGFWTFGFPYFVLELKASGFIFSLMLVTTTALGIPVSKWIGSVLDQKPSFPYLSAITMGYVFVFFGIYLSNDAVIGLLLYAIPLFALQMVVLPGLAIRHSPPNSRSAAMGLIQGFSLGGSVIGSVLIGWLVDQTGTLKIVPKVVLIVMIGALIFTAFSEFILKVFDRKKPNPTTEVTTS